MPRRPYSWHGYTCDLCEWGRDRPHGSDQYAAHLRREHCAPDDTLRQAFTDGLTLGMSREADVLTALDSIPVPTVRDTYEEGWIDAMARVRAALTPTPRPEADR